MNRFFYLSVLVSLSFLGGGCEVSPQQQAYSDIEGLTLADLQAKQPSQVDQSLLNFTILTYLLDADAVENLTEATEALSKEEIRYDNADAFKANGFSIGLSSHEQGAHLARQLQSIQAVRVTRGSLVFPPGSHEILSSIPVFGRQSIAYSTSARGIGGATLGAGQAGWVLSAQKDTEASKAETIKISLCPAFWEIGASDLRLLAGQEPYQFHFFDVGRVSVMMEPGQICLLGPERMVAEQDTLNRILFEAPRREKIRFFVIIYAGATSG